MQSVEIEIPYPPRASQYWSGAARQRVTAAGRTYRSAVMVAARAAGVAGIGAEQCSAEVVVHAAGRRREAIAGLAAVAMDALRAAGVYRRAEQVDCINAWRGRKSNGGAVVVRLVCAGGAP